MHRHVLGIEDQSGQYTMPAGENGTNVVMSTGDKIIQDHIDRGF